MLYILKNNQFYLLPINPPPCPPPSAFAFALEYAAGFALVGLTNFKWSSFKMPESLLALCCC